MAYLDRIKDCTYTSPAGKTFTLKYAEVSQSGGHKAAIAPLPFRYGAAVQDMGMNARTIPLVCWIDGADYDEEADGFTAALSEKGFGTLQHPVYGTISVICTAFEEKRGFVDDMGRATFTLTFAEAAEPDPAATAESTAQTVTADAEKLQEDIAESAEELSVQAQSAAGNTGRALSTSEAAAEAAKDASGEHGLLAQARQLAAAFRTIKQSFFTIAKRASVIRSNIGCLISNIDMGIQKIAAYPELLVLNMRKLIALPLKVQESVNNKLACFKALMEALRGTFKIRTESSDAAAFNMLSLLYAGAAQNIECGEFASRPEAITARDYLYAMLRLIWDFLKNSAYQPPVTVLNDMQKLYNDVSSYCMSTSLDLPMERTYICREDETPVTLASRLYGSVEAVDRIISVNGLSSDRLYVVPAGERITYYA